MPEKGNLWSTPPVRHHLRLMARSKEALDSIHEDGWNAAGGAIKALELRHQLGMLPQPIA